MHQKISTQHNWVLGQTTIDKLQEELESLQLVPNRGIQLKRLQGLRAHLQKLGSEQMRHKLVMEQLDLRALVHHKKNQSSNFSFDTISQTTSTSNLERKKIEMFEQMKDNYKNQMAEKERELITLKKERYLYTDALEDAQYELSLMRQRQQQIAIEHKRIDELTRQMITQIEKHKSSSRFGSFETKFSRFKSLLTSKAQPSRPFDESLTSNRAMISECDLMQ